MENEKKGQYYNTGDMLWRHDDNALFQIIAIVCDEPVTPTQDKTYYKLHCVNGVTEDDEIAYCNLVATGKTALSPIAPSDLKLNQHIWTKSTGREYVVIDVFPGEKPKHPCRNCHDGKCEQCKYGYKSDDQIMSMIGNRPSNTRYRVESLDHKRSYDIEINALKDDSEFTMYPPMYVEDKSLLIVETDKTGKEIKSAKKVELDLPDEEEVDDVMNDKLEKESIDTGTTVSNSYDTWRNNLKVVNVAKFDQKYFQRGLAYRVRRCGFGDGEFHGIMIRVDENSLKLMKLGTHINYEDDTEIVEIPLKEYMDGRWGIVRLVEEVNK